LREKNAHGWTDCLTLHGQPHHLTEVLMHDLGL
jgi:hypothetical protein